MFRFLHILTCSVWGSPRRHLLDTSARINQSLLEVGIRLCSSAEKDPMKSLRHEVNTFFQAKEIGVDEDA